MSGGFSVVRTYNSGYNTCDLNIPKKDSPKRNMANKPPLSKNKVAVLMGSANDKDKMKGAVESLELFGIDTDVHVLSAEVCATWQLTRAKTGTRRSCAVRGNLSPGWSRPIPLCLWWAYLCPEAPCPVSTPCTPRSKCPKAFRWPRSRLTTVTTPVS